jgi:hypothetical protein
VKSVEEVILASSAGPEQESMSDEKSNTKEDTEEQELLATNDVDELDVSESENKNELDETDDQKEFIAKEGVVEKNENQESESEEDDENLKGDLAESLAIAADKKEEAAEYAASKASTANTDTQPESESIEKNDEAQVRFYLRFMQNIYCK